ncbi:uncharacterized protein LOC121404551 [Drosophila obscura]|uniref:uncharacterized protein LOC121404551 n=1 Tax=Drosophila obscura TaxID=7282 RepID=UPI001BB0FC45|nr:uncharacterized protein LOC121404551 [Drosophila obscura]
MEGAVNGGAHKKTASGRVKWTTEMENLLIDLWQENIDDLRGVRKNSHVYMEMAQTMKEGCDLDVGWTEVRTKVENLTKKYRMEKNKVGPSGGAPSGWQHFEKLQAFLGAFRVNNLEQSTLDNENINEFFSDVIEVDLDGSCSSSALSVSNGPPQKRTNLIRTQTTFQTDFMQFLRENKQQ